MTIAASRNGPGAWYQRRLVFASCDFEMEPGSNFKHTSLHTETVEPQNQRSPTLASALPYLVPYSDYWSLVNNRSICDGIVTGLQLVWAIGPHSSNTVNLSKKKRRGRGQ